MGSPIKGTNFTVASMGQSFCDRMTNLLSIGSKLKTWFDWAFTVDGNATADFKIQFLPEPGFIFPIYRDGTEASVKAWVEQLNRPDGDASIDPFWRLCDGDNGTPDLRGRTIIGAGQGAGLTNRTFNENVGSENVTLTSANVPVFEHFHGTGRRSNGGIDAANNDFDFIMKNWTTTGVSYHFNTCQGQDSLTGNGNFTGSGTAATTNQILTDTVTEASAALALMQPSKALWYVMRTARRA